MVRSRNFRSDGLSKSSQKWLFPSENNIDPIRERTKFGRDGEIGSAAHDDGIDSL